VVVREVAVAAEQDGNPLVHKCAQAVHSSLPWHRGLPLGHGNIQLFPLKEKCDKI